MSPLPPQLHSTANGTHCNGLVMSEWSWNIIH